eukprot:1490262-Rhodomonas_salina.1
MKEEWSGRGGMLCPKRLSLSHIFDRVEAVLKCKQRLNPSNRLTNEQICEVLGKPRMDPNKPQWMQPGTQA